MRVGVLGAGQLGRMLGEAGQPWGVDCVFLDPAPDACASRVGRVITADFSDPDALTRLAESVDVVSWEFENVPVEAVRAIGTQVPVYPPPEALEVAQDRLHEKAFFASHDVPVAAHWDITDLASLQEAVASAGGAGVLKTRRFGYDGKGQSMVSASDDLLELWQRLGGRPAILEARVPFDRELSLIAVRTVGGEIACWPLVHNTHAEGILRCSNAPASPVWPELQARAEAHAVTVLEALDYVGVLAIEWFLVGDALVANEMAPRVHNSGHWSIEGSVTSQFDNHLRAVLGLPLGATEVNVPCACVNVIGTWPDRSALLAIPGARVHDYGKAPRAGRKIGHVTVLGTDRETVAQRVAQVRALTG